MTTRHLLCLITLAGLAFGLFEWMRRRAEFSSRMAEESKQFRVRLYHMSGGMRGMHGSREVPLSDPGEQARLRHHFKMAEKYRNAADKPWLTVDPDPPEPK